jgi:hypothetical protein
MIAKYFMKILYTYVSIILAIGTVASIGTTEAVGSGGITEAALKLPFKQHIQPRKTVYDSDNERYKTGEYVDLYLTDADIRGLSKEKLQWKVKELVEHIRDLSRVYAGTRTTALENESHYAGKAVDAQTIVWKQQVAVFSKANEIYNLLISFNEPVIGALVACKILDSLDEKDIDKKFFSSIPGLQTKDFYIKILKNKASKISDPIVKEKVNEETGKYAWVDELRPEEVLQYGVMNNIPPAPPLGLI